MTLRIGIDFDNTIACYDEAFNEAASNVGLLDKGESRDKEDVKQKILNMHDGQRKWQALQGQVYGRHIEKAFMFPGLGRFLMRCKWKKYEIFIISHKTIFGHFDDSKIPLRDACVSWMTNRRFFEPHRYCLSKDNVFFADTRKNKISQIHALKLDIMIDDLTEVFDEPHFPKIEKMLFSKSANPEHRNYATWEDISDKIFGPLSTQEVENFTKTLTSVSKKGRVRRVEGGRNSQVFRTEFDKDNIFCAKFYPAGRSEVLERQIKEYSALKTLDGKANVPKVIAYDKDLNLTITDWIRGQPVNTVDDSDLDQFFEFVTTLKHLTPNTGELNYPATEACLCVSDIMSQIKSRQNIFSKIDHPLLREILGELFPKMFDQATLHAKSLIGENKIDQALNPALQILSPSDFGFHNAIKRNNGCIMFLDFEYFGLDDPVKLLADTLWHPGMTLKTSQKLLLAKKFSVLFSEDAKFLDRLNACWPLYGLRWCLILLNAFRSEKNLRNFGLLEMQCSKSRGILNSLKQTEMQCPYV